MNKERISNIVLLPLDSWHRAVLIVRDAALSLLLLLLCMLTISIIFSEVTNAGEAPKIYSGPYVAYVTEAGVYDGDTINAEIHIAPGQILLTGLRVAGVDTPEIRRSGCRTQAMKSLELVLGAQAKAFVENRYPVGKRFRVRNLQYDKYGGRHVAIVERKIVTGWQRLDDELLRVRPRIADPYGINKPVKPLQKLKSWCEGG